MEKELCSCPDRLIAQHQSGQLSVHMPPESDSSDDFLADVAAFLIMQRTFEVCFQGDRVVIEVGAIAGDAGLDAEHLPCFPPYQRGTLSLGKCQRPLHELWKISP